jgi:hypothetical protein
MSRKAIRSALQVALNSITPALSTAWENASFNPVNGVPYQKVNLLFAQPENPEYGSSYVELGIFQVTLMYPLSAGTAAADERSEILMDTFKRGSSFSAGGYKIIIDRTPEVMGGMRDGDRWAVPVKIRWHTNISI